MGMDDERRGERSGSKRRESARIQRPDPPLIDAGIETPPTDPVVEATDGASTHLAREIPDPAGATDATAGTPAEPGPALATPADPPPVADDIGPDTAEGPLGPRDREIGAQAERSRPSIIPALAALVVAVLAAGWIYLYNQLESVQSNARTSVADLQAKVTALEARPASDPTALLNRMDMIAAQAQENFNTLTRRVDQLPATGGDAKQVAAVAAQVAEIQKSLNDLHAAVAAVPKPDLSTVDRQIDVLGGRVGNLDQRLGAVQATVSAIPHVDLGPLTGKVDGLETRLKPVEAEADATRSPQRVAERKSAPVAVTAQAIVAAISAGQAFPRELAALQALGVDPATIAPLQTVAGSGAPTLRDLQADLATLRDSIVSQGTAKPSGSYMDRLVAGAGALVQVRPLGSVVGDTPAAIVARIDEAIGADDLSSALREWGTLPEASRSTSKGLADRIRVRLEAEKSAKAVAANAIDAMAGPRG